MFGTASTEKQESLRGQFGCAIQGLSTGEGGQTLEMYLACNDRYIPITDTDTSDRLRTFDQHSVLNPCFPSRTSDYNSEQLALLEEKAQAREHWASLSFS